MKFLNFTHALYIATEGGRSPIPRFSFLGQPEGYEVWAAMDQEKKKQWQDG